MIELVDFVRWLHIIGATLLLGTGGGIAFFMVMAHRTQNPVLIAHTAGIVVVADWLFTASAVVAQPITGLWLAHLTGWPWTEGWIVWSVVLYVGVGLFWLPVVWIQAQLRDTARQAVVEGTALPARYHQLYRIWFVAGFPAFFGVLAILWLMVTRPALG